MDEVVDHFFGREMVEQAQYPLEELTVLPTAQLLGNDDSCVRAFGRLPLLVERREIANIESEDGSILRGGEEELFLVGGGILAGFLGCQNVVATPAQINCEPGHDMAVEIEANEERFKAG